MKDRDQAMASAGEIAAGRSTYALAHHIGLRALGVVYFVALASYWWQADGLVGQHGILPFAAWLEHIRPQVAQAGYHHVPTLLWLHPSDGFLHMLFGVGAVSALLLAAGLLPAANAMILWAVYLSLVVAGRTFLGFQWDNLLLETGLLAALSAPWRWRMRWGRDPAPPRLAVFLFQWLLFRLMFFSGYVKLASHDPSWSKMTALTFHYWTQPLPAWTAWYANLLPAWFQRASCFIMFVVELGFPFLLALPRRARHVAPIGFAALMALIMATGNYTYFNALTMVLCAWAVDDQAWRRWLRRGPAASPVAPADRFHRWALWPPALVILAVSLVHVGSALRLRVPWPPAVGRLLEVVEPLRSVNSYGLFAVMTTTRPEIVIEGTIDGAHWTPYEFAWKPGAVDRRPRFVAPHQPRLDWQMWFAALGTREGEPWFMNLLARLLENEPSVLALLGHNPFPERPPVAVRAVLYEYRFATPAERRALGVWWTREWKGLYCPPVSLNRPTGESP